MKNLIQKTPGKLEASDERMTQLLSWAPWLSFFMVSLPIPIVFLVLLLAAGTTEAAAIYLLLLWPFVRLMSKLEHRAAH